MTNPDDYLLVITKWRIIKPCGNLTELLVKMAIEIVDFHIRHYVIFHSSPNNTEGFVR